MNESKPFETDYSEFVEVDPTGRYGRYNEVLGKGASKTVYRAFDEYEGIEVAWNQVKLYDFLQSPEDLERLYCEIHLLKTLKHKNIMKFYTSWVDTTNRNINFVTEMFTSGTLRQYRQKHKRVNVRAVKHWCRQILKGLLYLHSLDPPVIHRDLKCDNIFINGNQGEVKIGDLGLAAILRKSHAAHCVGTPEFMAPEVYEEEYNELVDIYSFGMCILEMVTFEYPYSECTHPAQIYKKVISGRKPDALYKVKDPEVRQFVEKCLATVSRRLPARELLKDPFLQIDDYGGDLKEIEYLGEFDEMGPMVMQPFYELHHSRSSLMNGYCNDLDLNLDLENGWCYLPTEGESDGIELFTYHEDEQRQHLDISIKGKRRENDSIFLRLRIADKEGRIRNIYFPFDIETDTALSVATEMVAELDITDQDVTKIADMIDGEIAALVPEWRPGPGIEETPRFASAGFCHNCASNHTSNGSLMDYLSSSNHDPNNLPDIRCPRHGCGAMHGRFEEITYQVEGSEHHLSNGAPDVSTQSNVIEESDIWAHHEGPEVSSQGSGGTYSNKERGVFDQNRISENETLNCEGANDMPNHNEEDNARSSARRFAGDRSSPMFSSGSCSVTDDYGKDITQELRWLRAKYQMELRELKSRQVEGKSVNSNTGSSTESPIMHSLVSSPVAESNGSLLKPLSSSKHWSLSDMPYLDNGCLSKEALRGRLCGSTTTSFSPDHFFTAKSFYTGTSMTNSLHRTTSLPVDAVDV